MIIISFCSDGDRVCRHIEGMKRAAQMILRETQKPTEEPLNLLFITQSINRFML